MTDMRSVKEIIQRATLGIPKGVKNAVYISTAFSIDISMRHENIISEEHKTKKPFEIILHVGRITSLRSWKGSQKLNIHL